MLKRTIEPRTAYVIELSSNLIFSVQLCLYLLSSRWPLIGSNEGLNFSFSCFCLQQEMPRFEFEFSFYQDGSTHYYPLILF